MGKVFPGDACCPPWVKEVVSKLGGMVTAPTSCVSGTGSKTGLKTVSEPLYRTAPDTGVVAV